MIFIITSNIFCPVYPYKRQDVFTSLDILYLLFLLSYMLYALLFTFMDTKINIKFPLDKYSLFNKIIIYTITY